MTTYMDELNIVSGTVANTFGTAGNLTLNAKARKVNALISSGCDTVYTTAQGGDGIILQIASSSLGLSDQRILTGPFVTAGPATNSSGQAMVPDIIMVDWTTFGNEVITFASASDVAITTGVSTNLGVQYWDVQPPSWWMSQFPYASAAKGGYVAAAQQLTTTRTALSTINVPTWVSEFIAARAVDLKAGAITTGQYEQAYFDLTSSIPDISPMKIVTNSMGSTLGTPVGTGMYHDTMPWQPIYFRNVGGAQTIIPNINLTGAVSTGNQVMFGINWR